MNSHYSNKFKGYAFFYTICRQRLAFNRFKV